MYNICFYDVQRRFRAILASVSFSVFLSIYMERNTEKLTLARITLVINTNKLLINFIYQRYLAFQDQMVHHVFLFHCQSSLLLHCVSLGCSGDISEQTHISRIPDVLFPLPLHSLQSSHPSPCNTNKNQNFFDAFL